MSNASWPTICGRYRSGAVASYLRTFAYDPVISFVFYVDGAEVDA